ncbi:MAG: universal stress protein [Thermodesulfobacteriota bacterium]
MAAKEKILIAVDETETSFRALRYVARLVCGMEEVEVCLLHIYPEPPPDFYMQGGILDDYRKEQDDKAGRVFSDGRELLVKAGVADGVITTDNRYAEGRTISEELIKVRKEGEYTTVVVGKRGVSRAEEFLFGSISNTLAQHSGNFTTWIVGSDD